MVHLLLMFETIYGKYKRLLMIALTLHGHAEQQCAKAKDQL